MSKGDGQKIAIKFTQNLIGDVTENELAFTISGQEYNYVPEGMLESKNYAVESIERYPPNILANANLNTGTLIGLMNNQGLQLLNTGINEDFEDAVFNINISGTWSRSTVSAKDGIYSLKSATIGNNGSTSATLTFDTVTSQSVTWWYRISSETNYDKLNITFNDVVVVNAISGAGSWVQITRTTIAGTNTIVATYSKDSSQSANLDAAFIDSITVVGENYTAGSYISECINLQNITLIPRIHWDALVPINTTLIISTAETSSDVISGTESWIERTNGEVLLDVSYGQAKYLWFKAVFAGDGTSTSILNSLTLEEDINLPQDMILLTINSLTRFNDAIGNLTVSYDSTTGNLTGVNGVVESFSEIFTPIDLMQVLNPYIPENITASILPAFVVAQVYYSSGYINENLTASLATTFVVIQLIYTYETENLTASLATTFVVTKTGSNPL